MSWQALTATPDFAYKLGAGRYIQEHGAICRLDTEIARVGAKAYILAGERAYSLVDKAAGGLAKNAWQAEIYTGACCMEHAELIADRMRRDGFDVIVGIGGGRILDLVKTAAHIADVPVITIPTSSATCAAYTPLSVIYTPEGKTRGTIYFPTEVSAVLADMDIIGRQPPRLLAAGAVDAMAKWVEVRHHLSERQAQNAEDFSMAAMIAEHLFQRLVGQALDAYQACTHDGADQTMFNVVYGSIVGAGMVSGTARGQYQSALAHAVYEWARSECYEETMPWLHGEIVGVGMFLQMAYTGDTELADALRPLMRAMGMPTTFAGIDIPMTQTRRQALYDVLVASRFVGEAKHKRIRLREAIEAVE
jgi:glycerol dehydrogenase-like iron-containing ADH family enzyme